MIAPSVTVRRQLLLAAVPIGVAVAVRIWRGGPPAFANDDAYISQHAAHYLTAGVDPAYGGSPFTGVTSPLHVVALWIAMRALSPSVAVEAIGWLGAAAYFAAVATLVVSRLSSGWQQAAVVAVSALAGSVVIQLANGQETGWAMAASMWGCYWLTSDRPEQSRLAWLAGVLPALRPDLGLLGLALFAWRLWKVPSAWIRDTAIVIGTWAAYAACMWVATGAVLPNTLAAKREFFATYSMDLQIRILAGAILIVQWLLILGPLAIALVLSLRRPSDRFVALAFACVIVGLTLASPNVIRHNDYRYLYPLAMPLVLAGLCSATGRWRVLLLTVSLVWGIGVAPQRWAEFRAAEELYVTGQRALAQWINTNTTPGTSILVHDAGYLSEYTQARLTDLVGLKSPASIAWHRRYTGPDLGHGRARAMHEIACRASPQYLVAFSGWERAFVVTRGLAEYGWGPIPVFQHEAQSPEGRIAYTIYKLTPSLNCGLSVRTP
jgi:hypothetical protein